MLAHCTLSHSLLFTVYLEEELSTDKVEVYGSDIPLILSYVQWQFNIISENHEVYVLILDRCEQEIKRDTS